MSGSFNKRASEERNREFTAESSVQAGIAGSEEVEKGGEGDVDLASREETEQACVLTDVRREDGRGFRGTHVFPTFGSSDRRLI